MAESLPDWAWSVLTVSLHDLWSWWIDAPVWISVPLAAVVLGGLYVLAALSEE